MIEINIRYYGNDDEAMEFLKKLVIGDMLQDILQDISEQIEFEQIEIETEPEEKDTTTTVEEKKEKTSSEILSLAEEMIITSKPPRRGRPPRKSIRKYIEAVVKTGNVEIPADMLKERDIQLLQKHGIASIVKSEGNGYIVKPSQKTKEILEKVILNA